ncbi:MAG TPA: amino acid permease [Methanomassiliicoccales archaeon]|nr:amino acid permease [Methanomassiliicoccales archaeon]
MELQRTLGLFDAYAIGLGAIIGAGIFVVTGVAANLAGPALLLSLIIGAAVSAFTAISFAELAMRIPKEGGGYEFAHELVSPFGGFLSGWMWILSNVLTGTAVAIGFASYLAIFVPLPVNVMAALACLGVMAVNLWGIRESTTFNDLLVVFKVAVLLIFVAIGIFLVHPENFAPFAPNGTLGVMQGAAIIFFAYAGFGRIAMISEEVIDPKRTVPMAIFLALITSTIIYMMVAGVSIGMVGSEALASSASPLSTAAALESPFLSKLVGLAALAATLSVLLTTLLGMSRVAFAMARNGDLPRTLTRLHPRTRTPIVAIVLFGGLMAIFCIFSSVLFAAALSNFGALVYYALVNASAIRMPRPTYPRIIPMIGLVTCLGLLIFLGLQAWLFGVLGLILVFVLFLTRDRWARPA